MNRTEIISRLSEIVKPYAEDANAILEIKEETDFIADLKINSANLVDIVLDVEEAFKIEIDNNAMSRMLTMRATIDVIQEKLGEDVG